MLGRGVPSERDNRAGLQWPARRRSVEVVADRQPERSRFDGEHVGIDA